MVFKVKDQFYLDEKPIKIISGAVHYFRVVHEYWEDVLLKLKACGCNTVETYMPWNLHEPVEGEFNFSGNLDVQRFIGLAQDLGLLVIVRPGPYICSEWDMGGLPWWLLRKKGIRLRCMESQYIRCVDNYLDEIISRLKPLLCTNGGPIIAMQVENEYGAHGNDADYIRYLAEGFKKRGIDVPLFTSDASGVFQFYAGMIEGCLPTMNFGTQAKERFELLKKLQNDDKPLMCMEFWNGWFEHWGEEHHHRDASDVAENLDQILSRGSVNFYMFHGGTNFGFMNGANFSHMYHPTISSYDYGALISECGDVTEKYYACREVIKKYVKHELPEVPANRRKMAYGEVQLKEHADIFSGVEQLSSKISSKYILTMEEAGIGYGYILYHTKVSYPLKQGRLKIEGLHDRAQVFTNRKLVDIVYRNNPKEVIIDIPTGGIELDILVENMGRVNYGLKIIESKGITEAVLIGEQIQFDWDIYPLGLENVSSLQFSRDLKGERGFFKGTFFVEQVCDTFLRTDQFTKGVAFINGFNLGRYWEIGPTKTLYIPAPLLKRGENELIVFETDGIKSKTPSVLLTDKIDLG